MINAKIKKEILFPFSLWNIPNSSLAEKCIILVIATSSPQTIIKERSTKVNNRQITVNIKRNGEKHPLGRGIFIISDD